MTDHQLDHFFECARTAPTTTSVGEVTAWVGIAAAAPAGAVGAVSKLKLLIAKKSLTMFGITLGAIGAIVVSTTMLSTTEPPSDDKQIAITTEENEPQIHVDLNEPETQPEDIVVLEEPTNTAEVEGKIKNEPLILEDTVKPNTQEPTPPTPPSPPKAPKPNTQTAPPAPSFPPAPPAPSVLKPSKPSTKTKPSRRIKDKGKKDKDKIKGSGNVIKQNRDVKAFNHLNIGGMFDVYIKQGDKESVVVETDDNLQEFITVENEGSELVISTTSEKRQGFSDPTKMNVYVTVKDLKKLEMYGVGDLISESTIKANDLDINISGVGDAELDLKCKTIDLDFNGVGDVKLTGEAKEGKLVCSGVGDLRAHGFAVDELKVTNSGVGDVEVKSLKGVTINNSGVGSVDHKGSGEIRSMKSSGVGCIKDKDQGVLMDSDMMRELDMAELALTEAKTELESEMREAMEEAREEIEEAMEEMQRELKSRHADGEKFDDQVRQQLKEAMEMLNEENGFIQEQIEREMERAMKEIERAKEQLQRAREEMREAEELEKLKDDLKDIKD